MIILDFPKTHKLRVNYLLACADEAATREDDVGLIQKYTIIRGPKSDTHVETDIISVKERDG